MFFPNGYRLNIQASYNYTGTSTSYDLWLFGNSNHDMYYLGNSTAQFFGPLIVRVMFDGSYVYAGYSSSLMTLPTLTQYDTTSAPSGNITVDNSIGTYQAYMTAFGDLSFTSYGFDTTNFPPLIQINTSTPSITPISVATTGLGTDTLIIQPTAKIFDLATQTSFIYSNPKLNEYASVTELLRSYAFLTPSDIASDVTTVYPNPRIVDADLAAVEHIVGGPQTTDTAHGTETLAKYVRLLVAENGLAHESFMLLVRSADTAHGAEVDALIFAPHDSGTDTVTITMGMAITTAGTGTETVKQVALIILTNSHHGTEALTIGLHPTATGTGLETLTKGPLVAESGTSSLVTHVGPLIIEQGLEAERLIILESIATKGFAQAVFATEIFGAGGPTGALSSQPGIVQIGALLLAYNLLINSSHGLHVLYSVTGGVRNSLTVQYQIIPITLKILVNGLSTFPAPETITYQYPSVTYDLRGRPILQGYMQMTWSWEIQTESEMQQVMQLYNPANPKVIVTFPNEYGVWVTRPAYLLPPVLGTRQTVIHQHVQLFFTRLPLG